jgi:hypothetical protein
LQVAWKFVLFLFTNILFHHQNFGQLGCVSFPFLQSAAILSNALILCLIAYDRYVCVVKMHPNAINQKPGWSIVGSIIAVWIVSIGIQIFYSKETTCIICFFSFIDNVWADYTVEIFL